MIHQLRRAVVGLCFLAFLALLIGGCQQREPKMSGQQTAEQTKQHKDKAGN